VWDEKRNLCLDEKICCAHARAENRRSDDPRVGLCAGKMMLSSLIRPAGLAVVLVCSALALEHRGGHGHYARGAHQHRSHGRRHATIEHNGEVVVDDPELVHFSNERQHLRSDDEDDDIDAPVEVGDVKEQIPKTEEDLKKTKADADRVADTAEEAAIAGAREIDRVRLGEESEVLKDVREKHSGTLRYARRTVCSNASASCLCHVRKQETLRSQ